MDHRRLQEEANALLSGRMTKADKEKVKGIVADLVEDLVGTRVDLRSLEMAGLNGRDKAKLSRLQTIHGRIMNAQVCTKCKPYLDSVVEDLKYC